MLKRYDCLLFVACALAGLPAFGAVEIDPVTTRWTFGAHESAAMYRRVGRRCTGGIDGNAQWVGQWLSWFDQHAPEKMEELGLNFLHSRFYKGMGWDIEKRDLPNEKQFVANCHRCGVRVLAYVQFATLYPEAMRHEVPDIDSWSSIDWEGRKNTYYGSYNYFRTLPCPNCREWEEYIKRICTIALTEAKFDGIMFDNAFAHPCYCKRCQRGFREYLRRTVKNPVERFGFDATDDLDLPRIAPSVYATADIRDPVLQEWLNWRMETLDGVMKRLHDHIKSVNPEAIVSGNPSPYRMRTMHIERGQDMVELSRYFDFIVMQTGCAPEMRANGQLSTRLRELKFAQDYGPRIVALSDSDAADMGRGELGFLLPMVEDIVFGGIPTDRTVLSPAREPGFINRERFAFRKPLHAKFNAFAKSHRVELTSPPLHSVRLFYPTHELRFSAANHQGLLAAEEIFIRNRVPFGYLISTPQQPMSIPPATKAVVVPGLVALADAQVNALVSYARQGGKLVITGDAGRYDGNNAERFENPLEKPLSGLKNVVWSRRSDVIANAKYRWVSDIPSPKAGGRPLMDDLRKVGWRAPVELAGLPEHVLAEYRRLPDGRLAIHLINFDYSHPIVTGRLKLSEGAKAMVETPFDDDSTPRSLGIDGVLPPFRLYELVTLAELPNGISQ